MIPIPDYPEFSLKVDSYEERFISQPKMNQVSTWHIPYTKHEFDLPFGSCEIVDVVVCKDGIVYLVISP